MDLHLHTTASDGSETPSEALRLARAAGLRVVAVTDHDTADGSREALRLAAESGGIEVIPGIEFSCRSPRGKCHILGYGGDPGHLAFAAALAEGRRRRAALLERRLEMLEARFGIVFTAPELRWLRTQNSPGKPHLARLLTDRGLAPDTGTAIRRWLDPLGGGEDRIPAAEAVGAILRSGGIPVWAHPLGGEGERRLTPAEFAAQLDELAGAGIAGLECFYSRYTLAEAAALEAEARARGLLVSAGSDWHGSAKKNIALGQLNAEGVPVARERVTVLRALGIRGAADGSKGAQTEGS